jgi:membrane protease YdiL (CAAX protease family)
MPTRLSDAWWFARIAPHPVPASLMLQTRVVIVLFLLVTGVPGLADLFFLQGSYNVLDISYVIPSICISLSFLILIVYLVRLDGGSWDLFWNPKFVPNAICILLTPFALGIGQWGLTPIVNWAVKSWPALLPYRAVDAGGFPVKLMLPMIFFAIVCQEVVAHAFILTRARQSGIALRRALFWSAILYAAGGFGWGIDTFLSALITGALLALVYARWGGLAGIILGRMAWEISNFVKM